MQKTILQLTITLRGPLLTQSSSPGELGLDAVVARNHDNQPYLPGSLISGKVRQSLEELDDTLLNEEKPDWFAPKLDDWLGKESKDDFAASKQLYFSDFVLDSEGADSDTRYRIKIDPERGAVEKSQILMLENPFVSGESYSFSGKVHFFSSQSYANTIKKHLDVAIKWFSNLGALTSVGFGQVEKAEVNRQGVLTYSAFKNEPANTPERLFFCIRPDYAFCLAGIPNADNLFKSELIIPGSAIKACIANTWNYLLDKQHGNGSDLKQKESLECLSQLRISHAFPGQTDKRPVVAPLSIVKITKGKGENKEVFIYDVAQLSTPCLIDKKAPDFAVDWKNSEQTLAAYPWPYIRFKNWGWEDRLQSELRVHTAIDRNTNRSAENELFAYEQVIPEESNWYGEIDFSNIKSEEKRAKVFGQLKTVCQHGLFGLGKTKTPFDIQFSDNIEPVISNELSPMENNCWLITLQTDTLLGSPETLDESSGQEKLEQMYQQVWTEISDSKLTLLRYFARQKLSGGRFRFQTMQHNNQSTKYRPWLLTEAGSVFVLQGDDETAIKKLLNDWLSHGLPLAKSTIEWYKLGDDLFSYWQSTPFVAENGFGEIAVNVQEDDITRLQDSSKNVEPITGVELPQYGENQ